MGTTVLKRNSFIPKVSPICWIGIHQNHKDAQKPYASYCFYFGLYFDFLSTRSNGCPRETREAEGVEGGMTNALKYLEELDKYYSQVARPRQRRVEQNPSSALERLSAIKNYYSEMGRSRFGKRSGGTMYAKSPVDNMMYYPGYEQLYE